MLLMLEALVRLPTMEMPAVPAWRQRADRRLRYMSPALSETMLAAKFCAVILDLLHLHITLAELPRRATLPVVMKARVVVHGGASMCLVPSVLVPVPMSLP